MGIKATDQSTVVRTRRAIVKLLKQEGPTDALALSVRLKVTAMAVRQHLYELQKQGLVTYSEEPRSMGRPAKIWELTPAADRLFPDGYAELTLSLIHLVKEAFGEAGLDRLLDIRTQQQIAAYHAQMTDLESLQQRLEILAAIRTDEGYMAEIQPLADGSFLLIENHCPICAAATACIGLCAKELEMFQAILGEEAIVERKEHIIAGERRCVYRVFYSVELLGNR
ncbi:MAG: transcriptional regulator [Cyanobacteria bacterium CRU_2_1]|nr:transcriptional regulator [Cyanobacteria bacterium RU_5_0]NJR58650.1 transcriptional regulator [Cyanobacteria bacterium CRU_2_1]